MKKSLKIFIHVAFFIFPIYNLIAIENSSEPAADIKYQIYHDTTDTKNPKLTITCGFNPKVISLQKSKKEKNYFFYLELPQKWSSTSDLNNYIHHLHFLDRHTKIIDLPDITTKKIIINPLQEWITFSYDVYPKKQIELFDSVVNNDVFHFIGYTLLVYPQMDFNKKVNITFETNSSLKENLFFANSFGVGKLQKLNAPVKETRVAAYGGGKFQRNELQAGRTTVFSYGLKKETKIHALDLLNKIIPIQNTFWNEKRDKNNIVFIYADDLVQTHMGGTCTKGVLSLILNETSPFLKEDLPEFLAHEFWHTWMGGQFFSAHSYRHMAWLFEGVTDYYAHKTAYQSGLIDLSSWKDKYNRILARHYLSSVKNKSNEHIIRYFDKDPLYEKLPYDRGEIIAVELDNRIRHSSQGGYSFDDVIKDLFSDKSKRTYETRDFQKSLQKFYPEAKKFVKLYMTEGKDLPISASFLDETKKLKWVKIKPEDYGVDLKSTLMDKVVSGVNKKCAAYKNGLRNGQKVVSHQVNYKDINKPIFLKTLARDNTEQEFLLERKGKGLLVPQYY